MKPFALCSSRVCTPDGVRPAAVLIRGETIEAVTDLESLDSDIDRFEYGDFVISPGVIDTHVHVNEPGTNWEGFESATQAAAAGGVTTIVDMPLNSLPVTTNVEALEKKRAAARGRCWVDVGFYGGLVPGNGDDIPELIQKGVLGIKTFLCHSGLEQFPNVNEEDLRLALPKLKKRKIPLLVHAELADPNWPQPPEGNRDYAAYVHSRPDEWEVQAIEMLIRLCREFETPIHIVHLATQKALTILAEAKNEGLPITVETCPHYLYFASERIPDGETRCKCAPPIRSELNRSLLCGALGEGVIDTIGSDHSPCPAEIKFRELGDLNLAWGGISGLQLTLPVVWTAGLQMGWQPNDLAKWLSENPAKLIGYDDSKGKIAAGFDADIVIWNPDAVFKVDANELFHRHKLSAYDGQLLQGVVHQTFERGKPVFETGVVARQPIGNLLNPNSRDEPYDSPAADLETLEKLRFVWNLGVPKKESATKSKLSTYLNNLSHEDAWAELNRCCASPTWVQRLLDAFPFEDDSILIDTATEIWNELDRESRLEAFVAHPRIGDVESLQAKFANTSEWAAAEQADAVSASKDTIQQLVELNHVYIEKFGYIFIVCATGKSADEMLSILESRLPNDPETELQIASNEQLKITLLRLGKLNS